MAIIQKRDIDERLKKTKNYINGMNKRKETKTGKVKIKIGFASDMLKEMEKVPTGIPSLDMRLGGGMPNGRIINVYGSKGCNKTTATYKMMETFTEYGIRCKRFDAERQDDEAWMGHVGVPLDKILVSPENRFNKVFDAIIDEIDSDAADAFFVDSVDILLHDAVERKTTGDDHMTLTARKFSQIVFPKLVSRLADTGKMLILIFQARSNVGGTSSLDGYSGGNAAKHDSSLDLWFRRAGQTKERAAGARFKDNEKPCGFPVAIRIMKSKMYAVPEGAEAKYDFYFEEGINKAASLFEEAYRLGRINTAGSYYSIVDESGAEIIRDQGANSVIDAIANDEELYSKILESLSKEEIEISSIEEAEQDVSEMTEDEKQKEIERLAKAKANDAEAKG